MVVLIVAMLLLLYLCVQFFVQVRTRLETLFVFKFLHFFVSCRAFGGSTEIFCFMFCVNRSPKLAKLKDFV